MHSMTSATARDVKRLSGGLDRPTLVVAGVATLGLVMAVLLVRGLPPVNVLIRLMVNGTASGVLISPAGGLLAIAFVVLVTSSIATQFIATRRD